MKKFRDFESAREFVRNLGLKGSREWNEYCKSGNKPDDIPSSPKRIYKKEWKGLGNWFGTGNIAPKDKQWRPFKEARKFVRALNLKRTQEWYAYCKSGNKPDDIPSTPKGTYKNEWKGYGNWLGNERVYRSFIEAREFVRALNLKRTQEWYAYCKSGNKPDDIPSSPSTNYKKDFKGIGDWLGTGTVAHKDRIFRSFIEARKFARELNLKGQKEWYAYCKSGNKPNDIASSPNKTYKKDWKSWGDFTGTKNVLNKEFRDFKSAREFVKKLGLKNYKEWQKYCKSGNKPENIPSNPNLSFKNKGWTTWGDFLGTGWIQSGKREFRPFKEARDFVRSLGLKNSQEWLDYCKSGNKPDDIPAYPRQVYAELKKK